MDKATFEKVCVIKGDITKMEVDAIVNSANSSLLAGSGVCGAIHKIAGKELEKECKKIVGNCLPDQIPVTKGYNLKAHYVLHTVVPRAKEPGKLSDSEKKALIKCYRETIFTANHCGLKTLAFPSLGTGINGYPLIETADLAIKTVLEDLDKYDPTAFSKIYFVTFNEKDYLAYQSSYKKSFQRD